MYVYEDRREDLGLLVSRVNNSTLLSLAGIFNMTGNVNLRDFTSFHINFLDFRFQKSSDFFRLF